MQRIEDGSEGFVMVFTEEAATSVVTALRERRITHQDMSVLLTLLAHVNWRSGRVNMNQRALAQVMGLQQTNCSTSVRRLQKLRFVVRTCDVNSGQNFFLINPRFASVGSPQRRGLLYQQFLEAFPEQPQE